MDISTPRIARISRIENMSACGKFHATQMKEGRVLSGARRVWAFAMNLLCWPRLVQTPSHEVPLVREPWPAFAFEVGTSAGALLGDGCFDLPRGLTDAGASPDRYCHSSEPSLEVHGHGRRYEFLFERYRLGDDRL